MIGLYPDFFNDVFGPLMQPGSSSHTAGPCRLGFLCNSLLGEEPAKILVQMDPNGSFAGIFGYMSEDLGMAAGALGYLPDDIRLFRSKEICAQRGINFQAAFVPIRESGHTNALRFVLTGQSGRTMTLTGNSTGGGMVETVAIQGYPFRGQGDTYVVFVFDAEKKLAHQQLLQQLQAYDCMDDGISPGESGVMHWFRVAEAESRIPELKDCDHAVMKPILPAANNSRREPQLFDSITAWRREAKKRGMSLAETAVLYEMRASGWSRERVIRQMERIRELMHCQTHAILTENAAVLETPEEGNHYRQWNNYCAKGEYLCGDVIARALQYAYMARASVPGVLFVPGPMGRGGGFIYAVLCAVKECRGCTDEDLMRGLFVAGGVGAISYTRTQPTGEMIGCAGECGICMAMASAALTEMLHGTPEEVETAASMSMETAVGWPCDPIPGGYWQPCGARITTAVTMAITFADMARSGKTHVLPFHEVLDAADRVGKSLGDDCHCTGRGGLCNTPTAKHYKEAFNARRNQS